jgi:predicted GNAT family acetyltransferase
VLAFCGIKMHYFTLYEFDCAEMEILQKDDGQKGKFYIEREGSTVAEMTYVWAGADRIIIDHTEVGEALKGQGAGKQMVSRAVNFARKKGIKIIPLCPFARSVFDKVREYHDVL